MILGDKLLISEVVLSQMFIVKIRDNILDGTMVFTLLFGSELFEDYIGNLAMATMASSELTSDNDESCLGGGGWIGN
jgi:hypothetical protein